MSQGFRLQILNLRWHELGHPYRNISVRLQGYDLTKACFTIEADQIQCFHGADWSLVLTPHVSKQLEDRFGQELSELTVLKTVFVLSLGGHQLAAGVFIEAGAAAAINFPVLYAERVGQQFTLYLRPRHSIGWRGRPPVVGEGQPLGVDLMVDFFRSQQQLVE